MSFAGHKGFAIGHANVEDVPFNVSEKCMPPKKVTMPLNFEMGNPTEALFMEYDFNLESQVLEYVEDQNRLREEAAAANRARAKAAAKAIADTVEAASALAAQRQAFEEHKRAEDEKRANELEQRLIASQQQPAAFAGASNGGILMPTVFMNSSPNNDQSKSKPNDSTFDLADFERAQDPFDMVELEVLDDRAELNKVLQVTQPVSQANNASSEEPTLNLNLSENHPSVAPRSTATTTITSLKDVDYPDIDSLASSESTVSLSTETGSSVYYNHQPVSELRASTNPFLSQSQPLPPIPTASNLVQQPTNSMYSASPSYTPYTNYPSVPATTQQAMSRNPHNPWNSLLAQAQNPTPPPAGMAPSPVYNMHENRNNNSPSNGLVAAASGGVIPKDSQSPRSSSPYNASHNIPAYAPSTRVALPGLTGLRSAKSTPDITELLFNEEHFKEKRPVSHTPPPFRNHSRLTPPPIAPKPWTKQNHNQLSSSFNSSKSPVPPPRPIQPPGMFRGSPSGGSPRGSGRRQAPSLPNPYPKMTHEQQQFVNNISDMGFTRARVARTVEKLGPDHKKVLDHLVAIAKLEETGFYPDLAETALQLFENNGDKAKQFLKLLNQFTEFGFKEEKVRDALIKNNLDEDKTLDCLTASS